MLLLKIIVFLFSFSSTNSLDSPFELKINNKYANLTNTLKENVHMTGGRKISKTKYPFLANIYCVRKLICFGTLLQTKWVLTTAGCILRCSSDQLVLVGLVNRILYEVEKRTIHSRFMFDSSMGFLRVNDLGLIRLKQSVAFGKNQVQPVVISTRRPNVFDQCVVLGIEQKKGLCEVPIYAENFFDLFEVWKMYSNREVNMEDIEGIGLSTYNGTIGPNYMDVGSPLICNGDIHALFSVRGATENQTILQWVFPFFYLSWMNGMLKGFDKGEGEITDLIQTKTPKSRIVPNFRPCRNLVTFCIKILYLAILTGIIHKVRLPLSGTQLYMMVFVYVYMSFV